MKNGLKAVGLILAVWLTIPAAQCMDDSKNEEKFNIPESGVVDFVSLFGGDGENTEIIEDEDDFLENSVPTIPERLHRSIENSLSENSLSKQEKVEQQIQELRRESKELRITWKKFYEMDPVFCVLCRFELIKDSASELLSEEAVKFQQRQARRLNLLYDVYLMAEWKDLFCKGDDKEGWKKYLSSLNGRENPKNCIKNLNKMDKLWRTEVAREIEKQGLKPSIDLVEKQKKNAGRNLRLRLRWLTKRN